MPATAPTLLVRFHQMPITSAGKNETAAGLKGQATKSPHWTMPSPFLSTMSKSPAGLPALSSDAARGTAALHSRPFPLD